MDAQDVVTVFHGTEFKGERLIVQGAYDNGSSGWNDQFDDLLLYARAKGLSWKRIHEECFPRKTANDCKRRHERLLAQGTVFNGTIQEPFPTSISLRESERRVTDEALRMLQDGQRDASKHGFRAESKLPLPTDTSSLGSAKMSVASSDLSFYYTHSEDRTGNEKDLVRKRLEGLIRSSDSQPRKKRRWLE